MIIYPYILTHNQPQVFRTSKGDKTHENPTSSSLKISLERNPIDLQQKILKIFGIDIGYTYIQNKINKL
jgi:hypothetical protein